MFSKVYDDLRTRYSERYFKFHQTKEGPCQIATPKYDMQKWNYELTVCKAAREWPADATVVLKDDGGDIEDLPWFVGDGTFASYRFCDLAREIGEDQSQLLPVKIELDGLDESQVYESYSVVNWLREVDCLHRKLAGFGTHPKYGFKRAQHLILDETLIPQDAIVFRCTYYTPVIIVREDFLESLALNEITGWHTRGIEVG